MCGRNVWEIRQYIELCYILLPVYSNGNFTKVYEYESRSIIQNCFSSFLLSLFEYCAPIWRSAADTHFKLLDRSINMVNFLLPDLKDGLSHWRYGKSLVFFEIIYAKISAHVVSQRNTRHAVNQMNRFSLQHLFFILFVNGICYLMILLLHLMLILLNKKTGKFLFLCNFFLSLFLTLSGSSGLWLYAPIKV